MLFVLSTAAAVVIASPPRVVETRQVEVTQTVTLHDIPMGSNEVRLWVPVPSDAPWQRVLDLEVVSAPGEWQLVKQAEGCGDFVYTALRNPKLDTASVVVRYTAQREGVYTSLDGSVDVEAIQAKSFADDLDRSAPLMEVSAEVQTMADQACGDETDVSLQSLLLLKKVAEVADHYSKDPTKPTCGRGAASDCIDNGGGCCTDLHSLFISMARARDIPARMQYGYRLLDGREGKEFDPGYRCWVEYFVPGSGWVPTDVVAADNAGEENPHQWASLSATRIWLWEGRSFALTPENASGPVDTMICGWAEIDGKAIDPLPADDGTPSKLGRTVSFKILDVERQDATASLPN
jgi:hypothetical protein